MRRDLDCDVDQQERRQNKGVPQNAHRKRRRFHRAFHRRISSTKDVSQLCRERSASLGFVSSGIRLPVIGNRLPATPAARLKMMLRCARRLPVFAGEGFHPLRRRPQTLCGASYASFPVVRASVLRSQLRRRHSSRRLLQPQKTPHRRRPPPRRKIRRPWWSTHGLIRA